MASTDTDDSDNTDNENDEGTFDEHLKGVPRFIIDSDGENYSTPQSTGAVLQPPQPNTTTPFIPNTFFDNLDSELVDNETSNKAIRKPRGRQRWWMVVVPYEGNEDYTKFTRRWFQEGAVIFVRGQRERSDRFAFDHYQLMVNVGRPKYSAQVKTSLGFKTCVPVHDFNAANHYIVKAHNRVPGTSIIEMGEAPADNQRSADDSIEELLREAITKPTIDEALKFIMDNNLRYYTSSMKQIMCTLEKMIPCPDVATYSIDDFDEPALPEEAFDKRGVLLIGPTNLGKTQWSMANFGETIYIRDMNDWGRIGDHATSFVVDDVASNDWSPTTLLKLFECEQTVTQNIKYSWTRIKAGTKRIFCTNSFAMFWPAKIKIETAFAITRRVSAFKVKRMLYGRKQNNIPITKRLMKPICKIDMILTSPPMLKIGNDQRPPRAPTVEDLLSRNLITEQEYDEYITERREKQYRRRKKRYIRRKKEELNLTGYIQRQTRAANRHKLLNRRQNKLEDYKRRAEEWKQEKQRLLDELNRQMEEESDLGDTDY